MKYMKKFFNWLDVHWYEITLFMAGGYFEKFFWCLSQQRYSRAIFDIILCLIFLDYAKVEKKRYGK